MRKCPIPLLRYLQPGWIIQRCHFCGELAFGQEVCSSTSESKTCPPRFVVDMHGIVESVQ